MYLGQVAAVKAAVQEKKGATSAKISAAAAAAAADLMGASANKMPLLCVFSCVVC